MRLWASSSVETGSRRWGDGRQERLLWDRHTVVVVPLLLAALVVVLLQTLVVLIVPPKQRPNLLASLGILPILHGKVRQEVVELAACG
ncbi:unnamed protein product [Closterium sp. NIES-54]